MAIAGADNEAGTPLLPKTVDGSVDYRNEPAVRSSSGGWRSAGFIIGTSPSFPAKIRYSSSPSSDFFAFVDDGRCGGS